MRGLGVLVLAACVLGLQGSRQQSLWPHSGLMGAKARRGPGYTPRQPAQSLLRGAGARDKRGHQAGGGSHQISDCMTVSSGEEGSWEYRSDGRTETCGLYLVGRPDELVEVTVHEAEVDCREGMVLVFDGWELNGNVFPSSEDHPHSVEERSAEFCRGRGRGRVITSSQNAALVSFSIPRASQGFRLSVRYIHNRDPCNILMSEMAGLFTLSNAGRSRNCSLTTLLFPASFHLLDLAVGDSHKPVFDRAGRHRRAMEPSLTPACNTDFVELGGSSELDSVNLATSQSLCGKESSKLEKGLTVLCGSSTVRLVSSGRFHNTVTVLVTAATEEDLSYDHNMVITCPEFLAETF